MNKITSTDLADFGHREREMAEEILSAWNKWGLPAGFEGDNVRIMMNFNSGNVFLTNDECQTAMMNGDKLESHYFTPYEGHEGFLDELIDELDTSWNSEDVQYLYDITSEGDDEREQVEKFAEENGYILG